MYINSKIVAARWVTSRLYGIYVGVGGLHECYIEYNRHIWYNITYMKHYRPDKIAYWRWYQPLIAGTRLGHIQAFPDSKVHGADMGTIWGRQDPDGPHVGPMNFVN